MPVALEQQEAVTSEQLGDVAVLVLGLPVHAQLRQASDADANARCNEAPHLRRISDEQRSGAELLGVGVGVRYHHIDERIGDEAAEVAQLCASSVAGQHHCRVGSAGRESDVVGVRQPR